MLIIDTMPLEASYKKQHIPGAVQMEFPIPEMKEMDDAKKARVHQTPGSGQRSSPRILLRIRGMYQEPQRSHVGSQPGLQERVPIPRWNHGMGPGRLPCGKGRQMTSKLRDLLDPKAEELVRVAGERAHNLFMTGQLMCSEAVLAVVNRALGGEAVGRHGHTIDSMSCLKAWVTAAASAEPSSGGALALGLFLGRNRPGARDKRKAMESAGSLHDSFKEEFKSTCCRVLSKKVKHDTSLHMNQCAHFHPHSYRDGNRHHPSETTGTGGKRPTGDYLRKRDSRIGSKIRMLASMAVN